jgi:ApeA N-terminal domain 1
MFTGEIRGLWWLPETPTQVVSGVLTIAYDERPTLLFLGPLAPDDGAVQGLSLLLQGRREVPCVLGRTSNGEEVTLGTSTLTVRDMHLERSPDA